MIPFSALRFSASPLAVPQQQTSLPSVAKFSGTDTVMKSNVRFGKTEDVVVQNQEEPVEVPVPPVPDAKRTFIQQLFTKNPYPLAPADYTKSKVRAAVHPVSTVFSDNYYG